MMRFGEEVSLWSDFTGLTNLRVYNLNGDEIIQIPGNAAIKDVSINIDANYRQLSVYYVDSNRRFKAANINLHEVKVFSFDLAENDIGQINQTAENLTVYGIDGEKIIEIPGEVGFANEKGALIVEYFQSSGIQTRIWINKQTVSFYTHDADGVYPSSLPTPTGALFWKKGE